MLSTKVELQTLDKEYSLCGPALEIKPHPLKSSILKSYRLWQARKLLGGSPSEGKLCRFLNGIDPMPAELEASLQDLLKRNEAAATEMPSVLGLQDEKPSFGNRAGQQSRGLPDSDYEPVRRDDRPEGPDSNPEKRKPDCANSRAEKNKRQPPRVERIMKQNCPEINITFSLITAQKPKILSKSFTLGEDGSLTKISGGQLEEGTAQRLVLTLEEHIELLDRARPNHALCYGTFTGNSDEALVVTQEKLHSRRQREKGLVIARDRDHFSWPQGPGIFFGDYDAPATGHILTRDELLTTVYNVFPELQEPPHIWGTSASSCIFRTDTGEELRPISGQRLYIPVLDAGDIVRFGNVLIQRFWLAGHGRYDVSKAGALLPRNLLDSTMWQPERLDFIGGAHCGPGLEQRRPKSVIINPGKPFLDSRLIKDLMPSELEKLSKIQADAKNAKRPEVKQAQEEWISERLAGQKPEDEGRLRRILESAIRDKRLLGDFILHSAKHGKLTVGTILDNPAKFHGIRVADRFEPDYRNDKRIGYVNTRAAGKPYIWSWAHGGQRFSLHRAIETIRIQGGELPQIVKRVLELMVLDGAVFDRGGELVRLADGRTYPVTADWLQLYLTGLARFEIFDKRPQKWRQIDCPKELARAILSMPGLWELPRLEGLITAPTITTDGRIIDTDGFDEKTGLSGSPRPFHLVECA